ncbi:MAG: DHH family phosphoesterase [Desulfobacteraceae bacterium]|jgi:phosphoesterase RecJ-like protein|nr:DHH family phosphoesterase [Desulfobacteraceae bacterium]
MQSIIHQLTRSRRVLLTTHTHPDGDAIGSLLALGLILERMGKTMAMVDEDPIPAIYRFLPEVERITRQVPAGIDFDAAVVLDCGSLQRVGAVAEAVAAVPVVVNIDHHVTNEAFGAFRLVDPDACATTEIIYRLIREMSVPIDKIVATAIYTGIFTDTGSFRFSNTNLEAFAICREMVALGVDPYQVAKHVYGTYSLGRIKLLNMALDSIELTANGKMSIMTLSQEMLRETRTQPEDGDGLINYARRIEDVRVAALIQELNSDQADHYHVSLRSDGSVDVARIALSRGGGGHASAAGFGVTAPLADVKADLLQLAEQL